MHTITVTRSYLQLSSRHSIRSEQLADGVRIVHAHPCPISLFRWLYTEVGRDYRWRDRLVWTDEQCAEHLAKPEVSIWVLFVDGIPGGYFELSAESDGVWLHTCTLDNPSALPNYLARGFEKYRQERYEIPA